MQMQRSTNETGLATENTLKAVAGFVIQPYDYVAASYPSATQEVYVFKTGGSGGTTVATLTVNYTSAAKTALSDVTKT